MKWKTPQRTNPVTVLAAAAIFSRMRAWGRGALPINKMDWLSWVSQLGYTQLCVVHGTVSLRGKKDGEGELQLWYRAMFNDCRILYASRIAGHDEMVCELLMFFLFHFRDCTDKISKIKTLSTEKSKFHFVQYWKQIVPCEITVRGVSSRGSRVRTKFYGSMTLGVKGF